MRRAAKVDDNHVDIVETLRARGITVLSLAAVGRGCPDLLVGIHGHDLLVEVKDGSKPPSRRRLNPEQERFHNMWAGAPITVLESVVDAELFARRYSVEE